MWYRCPLSDEIDCLAPNRKDSGTNMQRVTTQLLTCMNGFDDDEHVVVIGATNRPNSLDPALRCVALVFCSLYRMFR